MFSVSEQLSHASKAVFEAQLASLAAFTQVAFDSGVAVIDLNMDAVKASLAAATVAGNRMLSVKDGAQWMSMTGNESQQAVERASAYGRQVGAIGAGARARFSSLAQTEVAASKNKVLELVAAARQEPGAALPMNALLKTAFDAARQGYDRLVQAGNNAN